MEKYFLIGIGGTGMKCIEAFTHLCAMGMFDNKEIHILSIDTDTGNGNKGRSERILDSYIRIKGGKTGHATTNTFFSAKLKLYKFSPEYSGETATFELISGINEGTPRENKENQALSDLFFDNDVQKFDLNHGYRTQTHLGSYLIYQAIVEAAKSSTGSGDELSDFVDEIRTAGERARVFIMGSIFGGTGASSIPIIPKALRAAIELADAEGDTLSRGAKFACSLLTEYFRFKGPEDEQKENEKIVADSKNFSRNSQAALMFYQNDSTVNNTYNLMYHIGWHDMADYTTKDSKNVTITGGGKQENPSHITELLCAASAYDFFNRHEGDFPNSNKTDQPEIIYRAAEYKENIYSFNFSDFFGEVKSKEFMNKFGALIAFAHIIINNEKSGLGQNGTKNLANQFKSNDIPDYQHLSETEAKELDGYLKAFAFNFDSQGEVVPGWLFQVKQSINGPFLFNSDSFSTDAKKLKGFHFGKLFSESDNGYQFATAKFSLDAKKRLPYEAFRDLMTDSSMKPDSSRQKVERDIENLMARSYNTLTKLFKIV